MLSQKQLTSIADDLAVAESQRTMIPRLTQQYPDMTIEDSYAVQSAWVEKGLAAGRRLVAVSYTHLTLPTKRIV